MSRCVEVLWTWGTKLFGFVPICPTTICRTTIDFLPRSDYLVNMRATSRKAGQLLTAIFTLSVFAPLLLCGGSSFTKAEASDCCRAMGSQCQKNKSNNPCCKHEAVAPLHLAVTSTSELAPPQPLATISLLPVAASDGLLGRQSRHQLFDFLQGHSPPESVPLFIFHSTLLI